MAARVLASTVCAALVFVLAGACVTRGATPPSRPADLRVAYEWYEGSLPPPYHYEYAITVDSTGQGRMTLVPDYRGDGVPVWTESFVVPAGQLDDLYRVFLAQGLAKTAWRQMEVPPVGGSHQVLRVTMGGRQVRVADYLTEEQRRSAAAIFDAVKALVPKDVRAGLLAKRDLYVQAHAR